jgi:hypothetical protein
MNAEVNTTAATTTTPQADATRDASGRFMPGNPGGPGNPFNRQVAAMRKALLEAVPPERLKRIASKMADLAEAGSVQAAKLVFSYIVGKPKPVLEPDRMDADEWNVYRETVPMKAESAAVVDSGVPEQHLAYARMFRPLVSQLANEQVAGMFNEDPAEREKREAKEARARSRYDGPVTSDAEMEAFMKKVNAPPSPKGGNAPTPPFSVYNMPPSSNGQNGQAPPSSNGQNRIDV